MKFYRLSILLFTFFIIFFGQYGTGQSIQKQSVQLEKSVDQLIRPLIDSSRIAGVAVGIMRNDSILLLKPYGYADLEFYVPLPVNASFEIGSITKQFTAVAIMQLADKGLIGLDDPITKYLRFDAEKAITIRQLLYHTSGIKNAMEVPGYRNILPYNFDRDTVLRMIEKQNFYFEPGSEMIYSNTGYFILGLVIEKVTGKRYEEYLAENIFSKAGMTSTYLSDQQTIVKFRAHGYNNFGKLTRAEQPYFRWTYSAGALSSTVKDLLRWNMALHTTEKILRKSVYQKLISTGTLSNGSQLRYAMGLGTFKYRGNRVIGHGGDGSGISCDSRYFPEQNITIITLQNTYRAVSTSLLSEKIADILLPAVNPIKEKFQGELSSFKGTYKNNLAEVTVDVVNSELLIKKPGQRNYDTLTYAGNQSWSLGSDRFSFVLENGRPKELHWDLVFAYLRLKRSN